MEGTHRLGVHVILLLYKQVYVKAKTINRTKRCPSSPVEKMYVLNHFLVGKEHRKPFTFLSVKKELERNCYKSFKKTKRRFQKRVYNLD